MYPSDYGREQLEKEEVEGPVGLNLDQEQHEEQEGTVAATAASGSIEVCVYTCVCVCVCVTNCLRTCTYVYVLTGHRGANTPERSFVVIK